MNTTQCEIWNISKFQLLLFFSFQITHSHLIICTFYSSLIIANFHAHSLSLSHFLFYSNSQNSLVISGLRGREYKPHFSKTILFFKNIDLCHFDEYGSCEIMELIVQLFRRTGFYTESLEWINVTDLIICCSMLNIQKRQFSPRFLSIVQNFYAE